MAPRSSAAMVPLAILADVTALSSMVNIPSKVILASPFNVRSWGRFAPSPIRIVPFDKLGIPVPSVRSSDKTHPPRPAFAVTSHFKIWPSTAPIWFRSSANIAPLAILAEFTASFSIVNTPALSKVASPVRVCGCAVLAASPIKMLALVRDGVPVLSSVAGSQVNVVLFHLSTWPSAAPIWFRSSAKIVPSTILAEVTASSSMVNTPALSKVASPLIVWACGVLVTSPINMLALPRVGVPVLSSAAGSHVNVVLFHLSTCPSAAPISLRSSANIAPLIILVEVIELFAISAVCTAPSIIFVEFTELSASSVVPTAPAVISRFTSLKAALAPPVMVRSEDVMSPVPPTPPTWARTKALVAASWGSWGSSKLMILLLPRFMLAAADPNPLKGMLALSSLSLVTLASAISGVLTSPTKILADVIALSAISGVPTAPSNIFTDVIASLAMVTTPALSIVASPLIATPVATLPALPTKILPSFKVLAAPANWST